MPSKPRIRSFGRFPSDVRSHAAAHPAIAINTSSTRKARDIGRIIGPSSGVRRPGSVARRPSSGVRGPRSDVTLIVMRALGVDYGQRRIGLALSDPTGMLARPWKSMPRVGGAAKTATSLASEIARLHAEDDGLVVVVIGLCPGGGLAEWQSCCRRDRPP